MTSPPGGGTPIVPDKGYTAQTIYQLQNVDPDALGAVRFTSFLSDCRRIERPLDELRALEAREADRMRDFVAEQHDDLAPTRHLATGIDLKQPIGTFGPGRHRDRRQRAGATGLRRDVDGHRRIVALCLRLLQRTQRQQHGQQYRLRQWREGLQDAAGERERTWGRAPTSHGLHYRGRIRRDDPDVGRWISSMDGQAALDRPGPSDKPSLPEFLAIRCVVRRLGAGSRRMR